MAKSRRDELFVDVLAVHLTAAQQAAIHVWFADRVADRRPLIEQTLQALTTTDQHCQGLPSSRQSCFPITKSIPKSIMRWSPYLDHGKIDCLGCAGNLTGLGLHWQGRDRQQQKKRPYHMFPRPKRPVTMNCQALYCCILDMQYHREAVALGPQWAGLAGHPCDFKRSSR